MDEIYIAGNSMQFAYRLRCTSGLWFCGCVELRWLQWQFKNAWQYCYGRANLLRIMTEPLHIQIVSDFVCPWCFVGKRRLDQALATRPELDVAIEWLPFQLSPDMPREGKLRKEHYKQIFGEERAGVIMANMHDTGKEEGIDFGVSATAMSPNTLAAHCLLYQASRNAAIDVNALVERLFSAHHEACLDIGSTEVLAGIAADSGMDRSATLARLESGADEAAVTDMMQQIRSSDVSGVPFFVIDGRLGLSGAQPADVLLQAFDQLNEVPSSEVAE